MWESFIESEFIGTLPDKIIKKISPLRGYASVKGTDYYSQRSRALSVSLEGIVRDFSIFFIFCT